jgi:hypothetical protein
MVKEENQENLEKKVYGAEKKRLQVIIILK